MRVTPTETWQLLLHLSYAGLPQQKWQSLCALEGGCLGKGVGDFARAVQVGMSNGGRACNSLLDCGPRGRGYAFNEQSMVTHAQL